MCFFVFLGVEGEGEAVSPSDSGFDPASHLLSVMFGGTHTRTHISSRYTFPGGTVRAIAHVHAVLPRYYARIT